jgi:S1-C subfamily serine protease
MNIRFYYILNVFFILAFILIGIAAMIYPQKTVVEKAIPVLLAYNEDQTDRSSAVYIGDGYFLTAAHSISKDQKKMVMKTSLGQTLIADLLWSSVSYDVSLFYFSDYDLVDINSYAIDCSPLFIGDNLRFVGSPAHADFVNTWGKVSATEIEVPNMWKRVIPVNATILPGMSGGAAIDDKNNLRGINVGTLRAVSGMSITGPQVSFTGISYIVEAKDICFLMGK